MKKVDAEQIKLKTKVFPLKKLKNGINSSSNKWRKIYRLIKLSYA